jgi:hypothetical protein
LHYELLLHGYKSIYLGQSVPVSNLSDVLKVHETCCFVSFLTVEPSKITVDEYIDAVSNEVLNNTNSELWLLGLKSSEASKDKLNSKIKVFSKIDDLIKLL